MKTYEGCRSACRVDMRRGAWLEERTQHENRERRRDKNNRQNDKGKEREVGVRNKERWKGGPSGGRDSTSDAFHIF